MEWFNYYGLIMVVLIMIPNAIYAATHREGFGNACKNKALEIAEQIGRYACMAFMVFHVPYACLGFWFSHALAVYLGTGGGLILLYFLFWAICWKREGYLRAVSLSVLPSVLFLFCGIVTANIPLIVFALVFAAGHIALSVLNAALVKEKL